MAYRTVTSRRGIDATVNRDRILEAAEALILEGGFAPATVSDIATRAGVSRATVFSQFGSKLGVLETLVTRCAGGPTMLEIREVIALDEPDLPRLVAATCDHWEMQGHLLITLKAISELEPGAIALVTDQRDDQRTSMERVADRLRATRRAPDMPRAQLVATLHMLTSVESFIELRRNAGLSLKATREALTAALLGLVPG